MISLLLYVLEWIINTYLAILFARMIVDWIMIFAGNWRPRGIIREIFKIIYDLTEPPLRWLRRYIPSIPMGAVSLDLSFMVLYFVLIVARSII